MAMGETPIANPANTTITKVSNADDNMAMGETPIANPENATTINVLTNTNTSDSEDTMTMGPINNADNITTTNVQPSIPISVDTSNPEDNMTIGPETQTNINAQPSSSSSTNIDTQPLMVNPANITQSNNTSVDANNTHQVPQIPANNSTIPENSTKSELNSTTDATISIGKCKILKYYKL